MPPGAGTVPPGGVATVRAGGAGTVRAGGAGTVHMCILAQLNARSAMEISG